MAIEKIVKEGDTYVHYFVDENAEDTAHDAPIVDPETGETTAHHDNNFTGELRTDEDFQATLDDDDENDPLNKRG